MAVIEKEALFAAAKAFTFEGEVLSAESYGSGHINDTFCVVCKVGGGQRRYILQHVNTTIFKKPEELMQNIANVTAHIRAAIEKNGGDPLRETLNLVPTHEGKSFHVDSAGGYWRAYLFIEDATTYQIVSNARDFYNSARAFGQFQLLLSDFPAHTLFETIPNFHNTVDRMRLFHEALASDRFGRAKDVQKEIDFVLAREKEASHLLHLLESGDIPLRVTHNDTKLNNVMIDDKTGEGVCVIDLDTVMPGLSLYDYGDSIRFGASTALEDEVDLSKVQFDLGLFEAYTKGYLEVAGKVFTKCEIESFPWGAKMMTFECGARFLTDHLAGDVYFKIHREGHNLDRARNQFKLVSDMEAHWAQMCEIVEKCATAPMAI